MTQWITGNEAVRRLDPFLGHDAARIKLVELMMRGEIAMEAGRQTKHFQGAWGNYLKAVPPEVVVQTRAPIATQFWLRGHARQGCSLHVAELSLPAWEADWSTLSFTRVDLFEDSSRGRHHATSGYYHMATVVGLYVDGDIIESLTALYNDALQLAEINPRTPAMICAETNAEPWLRDRLAAGDRGFTNLRDKAQSEITGLSGRGFRRVWDQVAGDYGARKPGRKKRSG